MVSNTKILVVSLVSVAILLVFFLAPVVPTNGNKSFVNVTIGNVLGPEGTRVNSTVTLTVTRSKLLSEDITFFDIGGNVGVIPKGTILEPNGTFLLANGTSDSAGSLPSQNVTECYFHIYSYSDFLQTLDFSYDSVSINNFITIYCGIDSVDNIIATNTNFGTNDLTVNFYKPVPIFGFTLRPNVLTSGCPYTLNELSQIGQLESGTIVVGDTGTITVKGFSSYYHDNDPTADGDQSVTFPSQTINYTGYYWSLNNGSCILGANPSITHSDWQQYFTGFQSYQQTSQVFSGESHSFGFDFNINSTDEISISTAPQAQYTCSVANSTNYETIFSRVFRS